MMRPAQILIYFLAISCTTAAQNVGIGTFSPAGKLHIKGTVDTTQLLIDANSIQGNSKPLIKLRNSNDAELLRIHSDDTSNVFIGRNAGRANVVDPLYGGDANTFIGSNAGYSNIFGNYNTVMGQAVFYSNTSGSLNTAMGQAAMYYNTSGSENSAYGVSALGKNTTGWRNVASGSSALFNNSTGSQNTATGASALWQNTTGNYNTANGVQALANNRTGHQNTAVGTDALTNNSTGYNNTAVGGSALYNNSGGFNNIAIGYNSGTHPAFPNLTNTVGIGNDGVYLHGASNQVILGNFSSVFIGGKVNWGIVSDGRIKKDIKEDVKGLDFISRLRPVTYHISSSAMMAVTGTKPTPDFAGKYDGEKIKYSGFIAQEVEQAAKASGYEFSGYDTPKNEFGLYSIKYAEFVVPLVKAVQEQQVIIEQQQKKIVQQQQQYQTLLKRIEVLEKKN